MGVKFLIEGNELILEVWNYVFFFLVTKCYFKNKKIVKVDGSISF